MAPQPDTIRREVIAAQALLSGLAELSARSSHDMVGPLHQAASLLALFVKRYGSQLDPEAANLLEFLQGASARMESVAAGVREYLEIASRPLSFGPVDLNASLASSLALLEKAISESGAVVISDALPVVSADAAQMVTIFEILIGNSMKFRRPDAAPHIQVSFGRASDFCDVAIADNGIGIEPQYREIVFQPFRRLNGREYAGDGLGLAMAKLITELHGGRLRIDPAPSGGTHMHFTVRSA
jgi:light-regulated signal transduction histidine kinase (bacteriophytochrome)